MNTMADGAAQRCVAQIGEALFGEPGMTLMEIAGRREQVERIVKDAQRYRWLRDRLRSANFEPSDCVEIAFGIPLGSTVTASLNDTLDAAMKEQAE